MQSTQQHPTSQACYPQVFLSDTGVWRDVRALHEYVGGRGYSTAWWTLDDSGHVSAESVGYGDRAFRRMLEEGRARLQTPDERDAWADDECSRRLFARELFERSDSERADRSAISGDGRAGGAPDWLDLGTWTEEVGVSPLPPEVTDYVRTLRLVEPAPTTREALRRLLHVRGTQWERHTGEDWTERRHALIEGLLGYDCSSNDLDRDALSVLCDHLRDDLEAADFDLDAADAAYAERCAKRAEVSV